MKGMPPMLRMTAMLAIVFQQVSFTECYACTSDSDCAYQGCGIYAAPGICAGQCCGGQCYQKCCVNCITLYGCPEQCPSPPIIPQTCPIGTWSPNGLNTPDDCTLCTPGTYNGGTGTSVCHIYTVIDFQFAIDRCIDR